MRTRKGADALFPRTRKRILSLLLLQPSRSWFLSDLARHLGIPKTSLQRELLNLEGAEIVVRQTQGRQVYFRANTACPFFPELQGLLVKTAGLVDVIRHGLKPLEKRISVAFVYGSLARGEELAESDVDLMVVGNVGLADLAAPIRSLRLQLGRDVNPTVYSTEDFATTAQQPGFVRMVLEKPKLYVMGSEHVLESALGAAPSRAGSTDSRRNRSPQKTGRPSHR